MIYQLFAYLISKIHHTQHMTKKPSRSSTVKEVTISADEFSKFVMSVISQITNAINSAKKGKIVIRLESQ